MFEDEAITDDEDEENIRHTNKLSRHTKQNTIKYENDDENVCETRVELNVDEESSNIKKGL